MITDEQLNAITEIVSDELLKRGFQVKLTTNVLPDGRMKIMSNNFQTTPVLYKKIYIEAKGKIKSEDKKDSLGRGIVRHEVCLALHARVELFSGGSNGIDLFYLNLVWLNNDDRIKVF